MLVFERGQIKEDGPYDSLISKRDSLTYEIIMTDSTGSSNFFGKILEGLRIYPKDVKKSLLESTRTDIHTFNKTMNRSPTKKPKELKNERLINTVNDWMCRRMDRIRGKKFLDES